MKIIENNFGKYYTKVQKMDVLNANQHVLTGVVDFFPDPMLGWIHVDKWAGKKMISNIETLATEIRNNADVFVVVGVGGSDQGARAVINAIKAFRAEKLDGPEIIFSGRNLSSSFIQSILRKIEGRSVYIDVIAKNFKTLEPGLMFRFLRQYLYSHYTKEEAAKRIITTPTIGDGCLHKLSLDYGYRFLPFPDDVGGRYSVFSPVGLLPCAVAGIDIRKLVEGAKAVEEDFYRSGSISQIAKQYALERNLLYINHFDTEVLSYFEPQFYPFGRWWRQLFAESEGKKFRGVFPVTYSYSEDLHSVGQYMQQGERRIFETLLHIKHVPNDILVPQNGGIKDGFDYLNGKRVSEINDTAFHATLKAHREGGVPCQVIELEQADEFEIGNLMYFYFLVCMYSSALMGVNPFDQPGVENYKQAMFKGLGAE